MSAWVRLSTKPGAYRVARPHAGEAVGLQLEAHRTARRPLAVLPDLLVEAHDVLHVVAVLVGDHVRLGERAALGAEVRAQLVEEAEVEVDRLVGRAVERARRPRSPCRTPVLTRSVKNTVSACRYGVLPPSADAQYFCTLLTAATMRHSAMVSASAPLWQVCCRSAESAPGPAPSAGGAGSPPTAAGHDDGR